MERESEDSSSELYITVSSTDAIRKSYQQLSSDSLGEHEPICTIVIPNQLLLDWNTNDCGLSFVSKANDYIINEMITLKQVDRLEKRLGTLSRRVKSNYKAQKMGSKRNELLHKCTIVYILDGEVVSVSEIAQEKELANEQAQQFRQLAEGLREEVDSISEKLQMFTTSLVNQGQTIDKVSQMQTSHTCK